MAFSKVGQMFAQATSGVKNPAAWLLQSLGLSNESSAGIPVTAESILGIPEVWMAVSKISGHLAQMPIDCRHLEGDGAYSVPVKSDAGQSAIRRPNDYFTKATIIEKWVVDALIYGNGRLYIERGINGQPKGLYPLQAADCTTVVSNGERWHTVSIDSGSSIKPLQAEGGTPSMYRIRDEDILYLMGTTRNGWWGENPIDLLRDAFGLAIAGQEASGSTFRNAGRPGLLLEAPRGAFRTAKEAQEFLSSFNSAHEGLDKQGKTGMIREGMKAQVLPNDTNATGYVQQRQFQRESVAMIFLLESVFGDNTGSTYKSVTERNAAYVTNCLGRWINKIQDECDSKLLSERQKSTRTYCYKMDTSCLFRHDRQAVAQYTQSMFSQGAVTPNEIREFHGLPPQEGADKLPCEIEQDRASLAHEIATQEQVGDDDNQEKQVPEKQDQSTPEKESK